MIVSHKYRFIFVKTGKVGGTSLETALCSLLGPEDIITPVSSRDELERARLGYRTCQHFEKRPRELGLTEWPRWLKHAAVTRLADAERALRSRRRLPKKYWNHMDARSIRERVGREAWDGYYKFTVERNPWDKVVSRYFWGPARRGDATTFAEYVRTGEPLRSDFDRYAIDGLVAVDEIIRYDRLQEGLSALSTRLGLPEDVGEAMRTITAKRGHRPGDPVESYYDDWTRWAVEVFFAREIRLLEFRFGDWNRENPEASG